MAPIGMQDNQTILQFLSKDESNKSKSHQYNQTIMNNMNNKTAQAAQQQQQQQQVHLRVWCWLLV
jgi:hypothetical protein